jgi:large subunit ribosomal protein L22
MIKQTAKLNYLRITPRKTRSVADLLRGLSVNEAEAQLMLIRNRAAVPLRKLLRSAVNNLRNNKKVVDANNFYVETIMVNTGPMLKRFLPRARGMATPIQKKMCHVTLVLAERSDAKASRFNITVQKKEKLPKRGNKTEKEKPEKDKMVVDKKSTDRHEPGFFKKVFNRKSI